ncbi:MAG TPA: hypothetical protein VLG40_04990 [Candidatus Saccharimonas sp.]|nr:hypothetical protein [Candidatus Saccharimonas sp.]
MKAILKKIGQALMVTPALALAVSIVAPAAVTFAAADNGCTNASTGQVDVAKGPSGGAACAKPVQGAQNLFGTGGIFVTITNILLFVIGAIAVVMLIVGGVRYVVSNGDQNAVTGAKNTILYAIIGIIIAFLAYAAVNFITGQLTPTPTQQG